ncbi:hypothetical protein BAY60_29325 [Prauserella muralis]|uniref:HpcH/HpaI aldolase/citrate lyase domain-containing protein n=1 Tax=Prauserella muralis TaxID=588067 RepID=A0A2V4ALI1_9PSEU|nr:hypothetical protein BAY60_29325 [Prauserella muralis]
MGGKSHQAGYRGALLFAPGDHRRRSTGALAGDADAVVLDLEDSVAEPAKHRARDLVVEVVRDQPRHNVAVRVNPVGTEACDRDLDALEPVLDRLSGLVVPKVESVAEVEVVAARLSHAERRNRPQAGPTRLVPVLESARGVLAAADIAAAPRVVTLMFGVLDFAASLGIAPTVAGTEFLLARSQLVLASAAAGISSPVDGPHVSLDDEQGLVESCRSVRALGFGGRVVIHPAQIEPVRRAYAPTRDELEWAREVLDAFANAQREGVGAVRLADGTFVERPVVARAAALLGRDGDH